MAAGDQLTPKDDDDAAPPFAVPPLRWNICSGCGCGDGCRSSGAFELPPPGPKAPPKSFAADEGAGPWLNSVSGELAKKEVSRV